MAHLLPGKRILIDGQQRVTALMAALLGQEDSWMELLNGDHYESFLEERRKLMAKKIKQYFETL